MESRTIEPCFPAGKWCHRLLLLMSLGPSVFWAFALAEFGVDIPLADQWDTPCDAVIDWFSGEFSGETYVKQHNEARKLFPTAISVGFAAINGYWDLHRELCVGFILCVLLLVLVWRWLRLVLPDDEVFAGLVLLCFSLALWSLRSAELHLSSITFERLIPESCIVSATLLCFGRHPRWRLALLLAGLAFVAQNSFGSGFVLWPLCLLLLWRRLEPDSNRRLWALGCFVLIALSSLTSHFWTYRRPSHHPSVSALLDHGPLEFFAFVCAFVGNPFAPGLGPSIAVGAMLLALSVFGAMRHLRRGGAAPTPAAVSAMVVGAYSLAQAVLAAACRLPMGLHHAVRSDYLPHALFLSVAALVLLRMPAPTGAGAARTGRLTSCAAYAGPILLLALLAGTNLGSAPAAVLRDVWADQQRAKACAQLVRHHRESSCLDLLYLPSRERVAERLERLDSLQAIRPGLVREIRLDRERQSEGIVAKASVDGQELRLRGWATIGGDPADAVVVSRQRGDGGSREVVAVFASGRRRRGLARERGRRYLYAGWQGRAAAAVTGYAGELCALEILAMDTRTNRFYPLPWAEGVRTCLTGPSGG